MLEEGTSPSWFPPKMIGMRSLERQEEIGVVRIPFWVGLLRHAIRRKVRGRRFLWFWLDSKTGKWRKGVYVSCVMV